MRRFPWLAIVIAGWLWCGTAWMSSASVAAQEAPSDSATATSAAPQRTERGGERPDRRGDEPNAGWNRQPLNRAEMGRFENARPEFNRGPGRPGNFGGRQNFNAPTQATAVRGFVFIDGVYVPPPYKIVQAEDKVTLNEQPILYPTPRQEPRRGPFENVHSTALDLASQLDAGAAIVAWNETPCVTLFGMRSTQLLRLLTSERNAKDTQELLTALPSDIDRRIWEAWLRDYEATDDFLAQAELALEEIEQLEAAGAQAVNSVTRLRTLAYPLTMFGMVLAVFSLGHLLQCPPRGPDELKPSRRRAALCRATIVSLALIAAFSGLDLVWTLLASGAGQMTELNPIGSHLLRNPLHLSLFKITATVVSCGLLMYLRQHQRAQLATWWMCLVCTVLTFRWLVLNSMFIT